MVAIGCMAWLALMKANAATASPRSPERTRSRGFCQYLALFTQHPYLAAQPIEFFALGRGQAVAAQSFIESSLLDPLADRLNASAVMLRPPRANSTIRRRYSAAYGGWVRGIWKTPFPYPQHSLRNWVNFRAQPRFYPPQFTALPIIIDQ
jgi:hypothetical protein